jgi:HAD superfamily hydrolase (TIGR01484 family)
MAGVDLVITDIDGTLVLPGKHNPTTAVRQAIADLQVVGIDLAAATGRPYEMTRDLFLDVGLKDDCIFDNGATIRKASTGQIIWQNWLSVERLKEIVALLLPHSKIIDCFPTWREVEAENIVLEEIVEPAPYAFALVEVGKAKQTVQKLADLNQLNIFTGISYESIDLVGIQVTDRGSSKFHAANKLRELVHSKNNKVLAIGDGNNDLPLFKAADIKVAMGNAVEELKAAADFVVAPVEQNGFAEAMRRFVLE